MSCSQLDVEGEGVGEMHVPYGTKLKFERTLVMRKKFISTLVVMLLLSFGAMIQMSAADVQQSNYLPERCMLGAANHDLCYDGVLTYLNSVDFGRDVSFIMLDQSAYNHTDMHSSDSELLHFDSFYELEAFINEFIAFLDARNAYDAAVTKAIHKYSELGFSGEEIYQLISSSFFGPQILTWWAPNFFGTWTWKNIQYTAMRDSVPGFIWVEVQNSWYTGLQVGLSWTHRFGTRQFAINGTFVTLEATGTYLVGVSVFGVPIGAQINGTWSRTIFLSV